MQFAIVVKMFKSIYSIFKNYMLMQKRNKIKLWIHTQKRYRLKKAFIHSPREDLCFNFYITLSEDIPVQRKRGRGRWERRKEGGGKRRGGRRGGRFCMFPSGVTIT